MLVLSRKIGEEVCLEIGDIKIWIAVTAIERGGKVKLGFDAPQEVKIYRRELLPKTEGESPCGTHGGHEVRR